MNLPNVISTREKIGTLIKRFMKHLDDQNNKIFQLSSLVQEASKMFREFKKALDIIFYFEGLGLIMRISQQHAIFVGFRGMIRKLFQYQNGHLFETDDFKFDQIFYEGKLFSLRSQILGGQLLGNIFYNVIYQKQATPKSSIQQTVQNFILHQKQLNVKNFVPEILNILGALNLIQKNQATQVITYVGPDFKCFDENNKKISWKVYEVLKRQQVAFGKQCNEYKHQKKVGQKNNSKLPSSTHLSYFPQLCYAVLRSQNIQKRINNTVFFIGRSQKRNFTNQKNQKNYKVDLQLPYKSVSRQHALIVYNFQAYKWEIRCLSKKNLIKVDNQRIAWGDRNIWLKNKSQIQVGPQKFIFLQVSQAFEEQNS